MAGDWIKMRGSLLDHPKVIAMARLMQKNKEFRDWLTPGGGSAMNGQIISDHALRCVTTALLMKVWSVAREHGKFIGDDLVLEHSAISDIDQMAGAPGVGDAMKSIKWATDRAGLVLPNFIEFNVPLTNAEKQKEYRDRKKSPLRSVTDALPNNSNGKQQNVTTRLDKSIKEADPTADAAFLTLGVRVLKDSGVKEQQARAFLGRHYKSDRAKLAEVVAYLATNPKIEPRAYIEKAMQPEVRKLAL